MDQQDSTPTVRVFRRELGMYAAQCECGWIAHLRTLPDNAGDDAVDHRIDSGHQLGDPLLVKVA